MVNEDDDEDDDVYHKRLYCSLNHCLVKTCRLQLKHCSLSNKKNHETNYVRNILFTDIGLVSCYPKRVCPF